jgi:ubiquinone/menaquinone biosynthesis C-methylase UbiE
MSLTDQNQREKKFHNELHSKSKGRFENIFYKAIYNSNEDFLNLIKLNAINSEVLDFGCGIGYSLEKVLKFNPKKITGIDISEVSILKAKDKIRNSESKVDLLVDNCEQTKFNNNKFDIIYGTGILHHLNMSMCLDEIQRILKPGGKLIFIEPLGTNPLINFYRKLTPKSRSKDEHPLVKLDFDLIKNKFINIEIKYYGLLTLVFFPFYKSPENSNIFKILKKIDQLLFKLNIFKKLAWSVLIVAQKN